MVMRSHCCQGEIKLCSDGPASETNASDQGAVQEKPVCVCLVRRAPKKQLCVF